MLKKTRIVENTVEISPVLNVFVINGKVLSQIKPYLTFANNRDTGLITQMLLTDFRFVSLIRYFLDKAQRMK